MKTCQQLRSASQRNGTNRASAHAEGNHVFLMESSQGYYPSNHYYGLDEENFEYNGRDTFSAYSSSDSVHSNTKSYNRVQRPMNQIPSRCSGVLSFSPKGSPWGKSVAPKLRSHNTGVKTVQTVAGPLLASTRFNINKNIGLVVKVM
jgi:hypothetical protein